MVVGFPILLAEACPILRVAALPNRLVVGTSTRALVQQHPPLRTGWLPSLRMQLPLSPRFPLPKQHSNQVGMA